MTDLNFEYWDDYVNPKPGQISIVDALRWRDDVYFINHDRLSGLKPSVKKRIREDITEGKPAFSVLFEPPEKVVVSDIPLPGEDPKRLFYYGNMSDDYEIPLPQEEPVVIRMFNRGPARVFVRRHPDIDLNDIPLPNEPYMGNKENIDPLSTCASDSGFSEPLESLYSEKMTENPLQKADINFICESTQQTVFTFGSSRNAQNQPITTESLENDINNNTDIRTNIISDDLYLSEEENYEISDSDLSEIDINLSVPDKDIEVSIVESKNVDIFDLEVSSDEIYLSDYEEVDIEIVEKKIGNSCTSDAEIGESSERPRPESDLSDQERDLVSLIQKLESFHLGTDGGRAANELVQMMTELKIKAEKFHLPIDVVEMLKGLNLDPKSEKEASLLAEELAKMTISLKRDLKMVD